MTGDRPYGSCGLWLDTAGDSLEPRAALTTDLGVDAAIIGAGFTGLWTAYYLKKLDPGLRVVALEKEIAGFGASGRNGGWCSSKFATSWNQIARTYGRDAPLAMRQAMIDVVDEAVTVCADEGIDARYHKGGLLVATTSPAQVERLQAFAADERNWSPLQRDGAIAGTPGMGNCAGNGTAEQAGLSTSHIGGL